MLIEYTCRCFHQVLDIMLVLFTRLYFCLRLPPLAQLDFIIDMTQTPSLKITTGAKVGRYLSSHLSRLTLEQGTETALATANRRRDTDGAKGVLMRSDCKMLSHSFIQPCRLPAPTSSKRTPRREMRERTKKRQRLIL